ncbi:MAG: hypothetical protein ACTHL5_01940 [Rhodanobacter sp.]
MIRSFLRLPLAMLAGALAPAVCAGTASVDPRIDHLLTELGKVRAAPVEPGQHDRRLAGGIHHPRQLSAVRRELHGVDVAHLAQLGEQVVDARVDWRSAGPYGRSERTGKHRQRQAKEGSNHGHSRGDGSAHDASSVRAGAPSAARAWGSGR